MKYCTNCGVELDPSMDSCPLCHDLSNKKSSLAESQETNTSFTSSHGKKEKENQVKTTPEKQLNRKLFWELTVIVLLSATIITFLIDLLTSQHISWSKYTAIICFVLFINSSLLSFFRHQSLTLTLGSFASLSFLILAIDYLGNATGWSFKAGIPLLLLLYLFFLCSILFIKKLKEKGINIIALILSLASIICMAVEILLDYYSGQKITMGWSIYVISSGIPISGILLFVHYRMKKGRELKRLFHL
ncbi:DUF6320 domain-containing protein [Saccharicrinis fermentans]|uniref:Uncharacterized protein n=1 Tax=Saccharicrinis fermentans DSM 9555 = JCM 21142 TaxID=869213 RepID=W7XY23_9BACT|nr:DUF6320 domain-containing protein [Saccharicrinis fermentans]GAF03485.1 hypothetical protein JCM21142_52162 [Saccharicrinis fermentans DSM 9555 = JCM 21142]